MKWEYKNLWAKSANRCSICKVELFSKNDKNDEFNIGEECHIISAKKKGPRHKANIDNYDLPDNLILLCRNHHKEIDELTDTYTEELLRYIKQNHENWVKSTLNKSIKKDELPKPKFLSRITSGKELLKIVSGSYGYKTDYDEVKNKKEAEYIGSIFQEIIDYGDISEMVETYDRIQMGFELNKHLKELESKGYYLFGEKNIEKVNFSNGDTDNWPIATLIIKKIENSEITKKEN